MPFFFILFLLLIFLFASVLELDWSIPALVVSDELNLLRKMLLEFRIEWIDNSF